MSFTEGKRSAIRKYMLDKIRGGDTEFIRKTAENFTISETSVRRYLRECRRQRGADWVPAQNGQWNLEGGK